MLWGWRWGLSIGGDRALRGRGLEALLRQTQRPSPLPNVSASARSAFLLQESPPPQLNAVTDSGPHSNSCFLGQAGQEIEPVPLSKMHSYHII
jgi:hypothetical protein